MAHDESTRSGQAQWKMQSRADAAGKVIIVGAGLVGQLLSVLLARRGYQVEVYDRGSDMRRAEDSSRKSSINLTLCDRGFKALDMAGIGDLVRSISIPAYSRMVHAPDGSVTVQPYGNFSEALYSVSRKQLNKTLLEFAARHERINFHFDEKCVGVDLSDATVNFKNTRTSETSFDRGEVIFGADGAYSAIRLQLLKTDRFAYSQQYLNQGYKELIAPATDDGDWVLEKNALHFWPRGQYILIGFPNLDGSFTFSLHMPFEGEVSFETIMTPADLLELFENSFPDILPYLPTLVEDYFARPVANSIVTIRCSPWVFKDKVALIGDAAHAIVPYYGQGANAGFEDCLVLNECLERHEGDWARTFREYEKLRRPNTDVIADLSLQNFIEICDRVSDPKFRLRKELERRLNRAYPEKFRSLYAMIAFTSLPYAEAALIDQQQQSIVDKLMSIEGIEEEVNCGNIECLIHEVMKAN